MTTSPATTASVLPSQDRTRLTPAALAVFDQITRDGRGADVHHWIGTSAVQAECPWCPDEARPVAVFAHADTGTVESCDHCVPAVMDHLADLGVHPEAVTLDVALAPAHIAVACHCDLDGTSHSYDPAPSIAYAGLPGQEPGCPLTGPMSDADADAYRAMAATATSGGSR